jgi:hypothetical protein
MKVPWPLLCLALLAFACGTRTPDVCAVKMQRLTGLEAARLHGLTQADDAHEAVERVGDAMACANPQQVVVVLAHARMLAARLEARGSTAELLNLSRVLGNSPLGEEVRHQVAQGGEAAARRLEAHARRLLQVEPGVRSGLMAQAWANMPAPVPENTTVLTTEVSTVESCFTLLAGKDAVEGTVMVKLRRAGGDVPLHGGSTVLSWSAERKASTRLCCRGAFLDGDTVVLQREGDTVATLPVRVTLDAVALGALRDVAGPNAAVSSACAAVTTVDALDACALLGAGGAP